MSDAMKDFFGDIPGRPEHPDFWVLSEIVLGMDALTEKPTGFEDALLAASVDSSSLLYVAKQRTSRGARTQQDLMLGTACWLDGFIAGTRYNERKRT